MSLSERAVPVAMVAAGFMIAFQVGAKATRDAFFLSNFPVSALPVMVIVAAVASLVVVLAMSRLLATRSPREVVPAAFGLSAVLLMGEWLIADDLPRVASVAVYVHMATLGAVLISGFWSLVNEQFDPRSARKQVSRISTAASLGGLVGGLLAERVAAAVGITTMLPVLALMHLACAWGVLVFARRTVAEPAPADDATREKGNVKDPDEEDSVAGAAGFFTGIALLGRRSYLRNLAALVALTTIAGVLVDYVFKEAATATYVGGPSLMRFFAIFYTGTSLITFAIQSILSKRALDKLGLSGTVATLPAALAVGSAGSLVLPGLYSATAVNGSESVLSSSLFRSGYELFYTPVSPDEKRASKTIIDVGFKRLGDAIGGGLVSLLLLLGAWATTSLMVAALGLSLLALWVSRLLHRGYVKSLEKSLINQALELDVADIKDSTTRTAVLQTLGGGDLAAALKKIRLTANQASVAPSTSSTRSLEALAARDPFLAAVVDLRSGDPMRIGRVLESTVALDPALAPHVIGLLAMDVVASEAMRALQRIAPKIVGQLVDAMLDADSEFAVRRRIPRVLRTCPGPRAGAGLLAALEDRRFEVRYQAARALARIRSDDPTRRFDRPTVYAAVLREASLGRRVWESQRLLDSLDDSDESPFEDEFVRQRANRSLEHVFVLLSVVLPLKPLQVAFRGLHTDDARLRGTALEYLETILPDDIREALWGVIERDPSKGPGPRRTREDVLDELMRSNRSIQLNLAELRQRHRSGPTTASAPVRVQIAPDASADSDDEESET